MSKLLGIQILNLQTIQLFHQLNFIIIKLSSKVMIIVELMEIISFHLTLYCHVALTFIQMVICLKLLKMDSVLVK